MLSFRVGQKNRFKLAVVPDCTCGESATLSVPKGATTRHVCLACYVKPPTASRARNEAFLRKVGLI